MILYIVDPSKIFDGVAATMSTIVEGKTPIHVDFQKRLTTFEEYNEVHGGNLLLLSAEDYQRKYYQPYYQGLQKPWQEITGDDYDRMDSYSTLVYQLSEFKFATFHVGERHFSDLHELCYRNRKADKYWCALRSIDSNPSVIYAEVEGS